MKLVQSVKQGETQIFMVEGSLEEVTRKIDGYFANINYKLESGTPDNAVYGIGNDILRIILGAFVKRYKFSVVIKQNQGLIQVDFSKAMMGISGGAIGYVKLNSEFANQISALTALLNS